MQVTGKLLHKFDTHQVSDRFKKREFVLEVVDNPQYPQTPIFQFTQDRVDILNQYEIGQMVTVDFNLRGREWISPAGEKKFFNTLEAWKINPAQNQQAQPQVQNPPQTNQPNTPAPHIPDAQVVTADPQDLPF